jgi:uncharacterized membrane protein
MTQALGKFLLSIFQNEYIATLFVSMFPLIELKGAIPIGTGLFNLGLFETAGIAYLGSTIISILVFFLLIPIFNLLKKIGFIRKIIEKIESIFHKKAQEIASKTNGSAEKEAKKIMMISLFIFVAVPFPVTGVWTGTAIAVFLGLKFRESVLPIAVGNLIAGALISLLTFLVGEYVDVIIYALFGIAIVMLALFIIKIIKAKPVSSSSNTDETDKI